MDSNDPRGDKVCEILQKWHNEGVTKLGISTHVFGEVVHNLFIQEILLPLEIHHKNQSNLRSKSRHNHHLGESEESVSFLYNVWKKQMPSFYKKNVFINISELIKLVKMNYPSKRNKLQIFYNNSIDRYNEFLSALRQHFHIEFLTTDAYIQDLALAQCGCSSSKPMMPCIMPLQHTTIMATSLRLMAILSILFTTKTPTQRRLQKL